MRLRLRTPAAPPAAFGKDLSPTDTVDSLVSQAAAAAGIDSGSPTFTLAYGYPPRVFHPSVQTGAGATLAAFGIADGETIILAIVDPDAYLSLAESNVFEVKPSTSTPSTKPQAKVAQDKPPPPTTVVVKQPVKKPPTVVKPTPTKEVEHQSNPKAAKEVFVPFAYGGVVSLRVMPDDNSCLFHSVSYAFGKGIYPPTTLRYKVADYIESHRDVYSDAILGRPAAQYCAWIRQDNSWGGSIELNILSELLEVEIVSIQVSKVRMDVFGEDRKHAQRIVVMYSGIHYDTIAATEEKNHSVRQSDKTVFDVVEGLPVREDPYVDAAIQVATVMRDRHMYTEEATFAIMCETCRKPLVGSKEANEHAKQTGHTSFVEYAG